MRPSCILVKDGGFGTHITRFVGETMDGDQLWSARFNATNPKAVIDTHLDFLRKYPLIVASIGSFGAHLHDGSEYTGKYADLVSAETIADWHRQRIDACVEAGVDALAIETIPCLMEAEAVVEMLCSDYPGVKFWIAFQCKDERHVAHGEDFATSTQSIWDILGRRKAQGNCLGIGVNCLNPKFVTPLFESLNGPRPENQRIPLVVYPNSGETYDFAKGWMGKEQCIPLTTFVPDWIKLGAKIIGGCCRVHDEDVKLMGNAIADIDYSI